MTKPLADDIYRMAPDTVQRWLDTLKDQEIAKTDAAAAELLGKSADTMRLMKLRGADQATALACAAVLAGLTPFGAETVTTAPEKRSFRVTVPLRITIAAEGIDADDVKSKLAGILGTTKNQVRVSE